MNRKEFLTIAASSALLAHVNPARLIAQSPPNPIKPFPRNFYWGTATSAYQIEGAVDKDGRGPSIWDSFCRIPGTVKNGDTGDVACDHYHRYAEDLKLMKRLHLKAYRFSIAWPRILPLGRGQLNQPGLDFYDRLVDGLLEAGIEPFVTLYHWDLPQALQDEGGWINRETVNAFVDYVDRVTRRLGDRVSYWITHNEPWAIAFLGHFFGSHAPAVRDLFAALVVSHHLLLSHGLAVPVIRANGHSQTQVGIVNVCTRVDAASDAEADRQAADRNDGYVNRWFLDPLYKGSYPSDMLEWYRQQLQLDQVPPIQAGDMAAIAAPTDFLGVNYYTRSVAGAGSEPPVQIRVEKPIGETTEMGWEVYPQGLYQVLKRLQADYAPAAVFLTENGAAFADTVTAGGQVADPRRQAYLENHLRQAHRAIRDGIPLRGYFVWSLLDNFEWNEGYSKRFGLTYVDFLTQQRTVKQSGEWYAQVIQQNGVPFG